MTMPVRIWRPGKAPAPLELKPRSRGGSEQISEVVGGPDEALHPLQSENVVLLVNHDRDRKKLPPNREASMLFDRNNPDAVRGNAVVMTALQFMAWEKS